MDANFWHERWKRNETAFHEGHPNPLLVTYFGALSLAAGSRIFVPLCGKSLEQLFVELGVEPFISALGDIDLWSTNNLDIFVGDLFAVSRNMLGPVDAIYDRAALVALPEQVRNRYGTHLRDITEEAPQLLICYEYDQRVMDGPPFSIDAEEVHRHYASRYDLSLIASRPVAGGLKGKCAAQENLWLLRK
jgi:thiopurine S-methyltransferase